MTRIGGSLERARDLEVQRDLKQYTDAAIALTPGNEDFNETNINKFVDSVLKISVDKSVTNNPYKSPYQIDFISKDSFKVTSDKVKNGIKTGEQVVA